MNRQEHYERAEALSDLAADLAAATPRDSIIATLAAAQVHATLALAADTLSGDDLSGMDGPQALLGMPNDRMRRQVTRVLDAADTAGVTIGWLTAYRDGDRISVQDVDHGYTPVEARALGDALGFHLVRDTCTGSSVRGRHIYVGDHASGVVEVFVETAR